MRELGESSCHSRRAYKQNYRDGDDNGGVDKDPDREVEMKKFSFGDGIDPRGPHRGGGHRRRLANQQRARTTKGVSSIRLLTPLFMPVHMTLGLNLCQWVKEWPGNNSPAIDRKQTLC